MRWLPVLLKKYIRATESPRARELEQEADSLHRDLAAEAKGLRSAKTQLRTALFEDLVRTRGRP